VFRGIQPVCLDAKGRVGIPSRYRERLTSVCANALVLTLNPLDCCLWLYPLPEWEKIDEKLQELSDFDIQSRRTKQMMRGYATDCELDGQGRILIPEALRAFADIEKHIMFIGQGNKFELWDESAWNKNRDDWLDKVGKGLGDPSEPLRRLSL